MNRNVTVLYRVSGGQYDQYSLFAYIQDVYAPVDDERTDAQLSSSVKYPKICRVPMCKTIPTLSFHHRDCTTGLMGME